MEAYTPLWVLRDNFPELAQWLKPLCRFNEGFEDFIVADYKENKLRLKFYTKENQYSIVARYPSKDDLGYLGCMATTRKPRAGEDWNRGRDLADGIYHEETWKEIMSDIISYELVKVAKTKKVKVLDK